MKQWLYLASPSLSGFLECHIIVILQSCAADIALLHWNEDSSQDNHCMAYHQRPTHSFDWWLTTYACITATALTSSIPTSHKASVVWFIVSLMRDVDHRCRALKVITFFEENLFVHLVFVYLQQQQCDYDWTRRSGGFCMQVIRTGRIVQLLFGCTTHVSVHSTYQSWLLTSYLHHWPRQDNISVYFYNDSKFSGTCREFDSSCFFPHLSGGSFFDTSPPRYILRCRQALPERRKSTSYIIESRPHHACWIRNAMEVGAVQINTYIITRT